MLEHPAAEELRVRLTACPVVGLLRRWPPERVIETADAARSAGIGVFEITLDSDRALEQIAAVRDRFGDSLLVGAGTVVSPGQIGDAQAAGAQFIVSPHLDPDVVRAANQAGLPAVPAVLSPTELTAAMRLDPVLVKLFPAGPLGPAYLRALRGPYPDIGILTTGGVDETNAAAFLEAGATAVALGSSLFSASLTAEQMCEKASSLVANLRHSRPA